jgi:hypothetical protein
VGNTSCHSQFEHYTSVHPHKRGEHTFNEMAEAYLIYAWDHQQKRSWTRDRTSVTILTAYFGGKRLTEITPALIEQYRAWRKDTISRRGRPVTSSTINRELACLKRMFNVARKGVYRAQRGCSS